MAKAPKHPKTDGVALMSTAHPENTDYVDGSLYVYDGTSQTFCPATGISEAALVDAEIEMPDSPFATIFRNQVVIMNSLHIILKQVIGDYNSLAALDARIKDTNEVLNG